MTAIDTTTPLQRLVDFHRNEVMACTDEERPFHVEAVSTLEMMGELIEASLERDSVGGIDVILDLADVAGGVTEAWRVLNLPVLPGVGTAMIVDDEKLGVLAHMHQVIGGGYVCRVFVQKVNATGAGIQRAPASALDILGKGRAS